MKIIEPKVELWQQGDDSKAHVARCARVCYGRETGNDEAFNKRPIIRYSFATKEWTENKNPICWHGGLFEYKYNILTGRYFNQCCLLPYKINKGWTPRPTITIDCVEIEIAPDNWIMAVDANNINLLLLGAYYNIQWEECSCLKGIRLEDVTVELEDKAYEEMRHNI